MKRFFLVVPVFLALAAVFAAGPALAGAKEHKVAIHVDENDPARMNMALNNAMNINKYYKAKGEKVEIEVVAYGPGLNMFVEGKSPVEQRIATMGLEMSNLSFSACGNAHRNMSAKAGKDIQLVSEASLVPSGVVRLMELQEQGWSYIRP